MSNHSSSVKFIADDMLGSLARLLRILGYDTLYFREIANARLIELALGEARMILTRDTSLVQKVMVRNHLLISSDNPEDQLKETISGLELRPDQRLFFSRCLDCNTILEEISKAEVKDKVWPYVFETQNRFWICGNCRKFYWDGTHVEAMRRRLVDWGWMNQP